MNVAPVGGGHAAKCPRCPWRTFSTTKAVVQQRAAEHEWTCKAALSGTSTEGDTDA